MRSGAEEGTGGAEEKMIFFFCFFSLTSSLCIFPGYPLDSFLPSFFSTRKIGVRVLGHRLLLLSSLPAPRKKKERRKKEGGGENSSFSLFLLSLSLSLPSSFPSSSVCLFLFWAPVCCHHFFAFHFFLSFFLFFLLFFWGLPPR